MSQFESIRERIIVKYPDLASVQHGGNWQKIFADNACRRALGKPETVTVLEYWFLGKVAANGLIAANIDIRMNGMSQKELAEKTGIAKAQINSILTGRTVPRHETLLKIANVLDCTVDDLIR